MELTEKQKHINQKLNEIVGSDAVLRKRLATISEHIKAVNPALKDNEQFMVFIANSCKTISPDIIMKKISVYSKTNTNPEKIANVIMGSLGIYLQSVGEPHKIFVIGIGNYHEIKKKETVIEDGEKIEVEKVTGKIGTFTIIILDNLSVTTLMVRDNDDLWQRLAIMQPGFAYNINLVERKSQTGNYFALSKDPSPTKIDYKYNPEDLLTAIQNTYNQITPDMLDSIPKEGLNGYIQAFIGDVRVSQKGWTIIKPIFETTNFDDGIPPPTVNILYSGATDLQEDDQFIAFGNVTEGNNGTGYTMYANAVLNLTPKEDVPSVNDEEGVEDEGDADSGFDMNDTGEDTEV